MQLKLDNNAEYIIQKLEASGFEAFAVGGCVRDMLLGREVSDFDITTSALPEETKRVFSSHSVIETGIKHGTVTVLIDRKPYEVTTYRSESAYTDSRHPDSVTFVSDIREDLSRRDFTINAIAFSPRKGIVDPFCGADDINAGIIRAVGNAQTRFSEDALRILRAVRFSSVLGFKLEDPTHNAVLALSHTLSKVSPERIYAELKKLLCGKNAVSVIKEYKPILSQIIPLDGDCTLISRLPNDFAMRFACLSGTSVGEALSCLRADNATKSASVLLANSTPIPNNIPELKSYISSLGRDRALLVTAYRRALYNEDPEYKTEQLLQSNECIFLKDLAVNGNDLVNIGIKGKDIGTILLKLLSAVHHGETDNKKEPLLIKAKVLYKV